MKPAIPFGALLAAAFFLPAGIGCTPATAPAGTPAATPAQPAGVLRPLEGDIILPDAKDTGNWFQNRLWWVDEERTHLAYCLQPLPAVVINTDSVKKEEINSFRDLLNPKWKSKIIMDDPTIGGSGNGWVTAIGYKIMDVNFLQDLAKQDLVFSRNMRQEVEWLARGKYIIGIGMNAPEMSDLIRAGVNTYVSPPRRSLIPGPLSMPANPSSG